MIKKVYNVGDTVRWSLKGKGEQFYTGVVNIQDGEMYFGDYFAGEIKDAVVIEVYNVKNVERSVKLAISRYCREKNIIQAEYLKTDRRIRELLTK
jgi:hypothetical protein